MGQFYNMVPVVTFEVIILIHSLFALKEAPNIFEELELELNLASLILKFENNTLWIMNLAM